MANRIRIARDTFGGDRTVDVTYNYSAICDNPKGQDSIRPWPKWVSNLQLEMGTIRAKSLETFVPVRFKGRIR